MAKVGRKLGNRQSIGDRLERSIKIDSNDCWVWQLSTNKLGYGLMRVENKMRTPHRVSYEYYNDTVIPAGMCVCHRCDRPSCINPDHLWLGTRKQNTADMESKGRHRYWGNVSKKGTPRPRGTCKYCGINQAVTTLGRYHNDKCKQKPL